MDEAARLFTHVFFVITTTWAETHSFRSIVDSGMEEAAARLLRQNLSWFSAFVDDPANAAMFLDKTKFLESYGGRQGAAQKLTEQGLTAYQGAVDAASLVFMHSALDGALQDLCRVTALVDPSKWHPLFENRSERLAVIRTKGYERIMAERLSAFMDEISRESVLKKTDRLFQICRPDKFSRKGFHFDRDRLKKVDDVRHEIIHGDHPRVPISDVTEMIDYMRETGLFFFGLVNHRYGVRLDPAYVRLG